MKNALETEFEALDLPDKRLDKRARATLTAFAAKPGAGAPSALSEAELEGFYRFVNNERVSFEALLAAHVEATRQRATGRERIVVAHDTTDFRFSDEVAREGLGPMDNAGQGFYAHFSLAVGDLKQALGVVGVDYWMRASRDSANKTRKQCYEDPEKESLCWMRAVHAAEKLFAGGLRLIHVMDRGADDYDILCELTTSGYGFVVRASHDRRIVQSADRLMSFARELEVRCERQVRLSNRRKKRPPKQRKLYPPRDVRTAELVFAAQRVTLVRPLRSRAELKELSLNIVHVHEPNPPAGCEPVEWFLLTSEPIDTPEQILQVVDDYRSRWVIEEYFKALKTGCAYEKRQHESSHALLNVLGVFVPIAWSLLNMRTLSRDARSARLPAHRVFSRTQIRILCAESKGKLAEAPTVGEATYAMARYLGGFLPSNGRPGWHVLGRAFEKLLMLEAGWRMAMRQLSNAPSK